MAVVGIAVAGGITWRSLSGSEKGSSDVVGAVVKSRTSGAVPSAGSVAPASGARFDIFSIKRKGASRLYVSSLMLPKSWYVPPPPPPKPVMPANPVPAAPPAPPPLPFAYIGRVIDGQDVTVFLSGNNTQYSVKTNDTIDDKYHVDKITDDEIILTYLPLKIQQTLRVGDGAGETLAPHAPVPVQNTAAPKLLPPQNRPSPFIK